VVDNGRVLLLIRLFQKFSLRQIRIGMIT
jgi:hypothetical protein